MSNLSEDAQKLLELLPETGRILNRTAMNITGWDFERVKKAKFELRESGLVEIKPSFGGPFGKIHKKGIKKTKSIIISLSEKELYEPFKNWILEEFRPSDLVKERDLFDVIISADKRPKEKRRWDIPDLISISFVKYRYTPELNFNTISFEVKRKKSAFELNGIFEAISHSKYGKYTYYCFEWPEDDDFYDNIDYQRIEQEAQIHGIGLIQLWFKDKDKKYIDGDIILEAKELGYDPEILSQFIEKFFPNEIKDRLLRMTNSY
ncbi:MAG: hypothetical protein A2X61_14790 [Ignavibacteria bacterium GWB2_35_12]|nr:MAG: hypothetical protein A2X63_06720 [Ignavibacteria bacterium GWA2_35_8]OGU38348.1 MAG: hypothetical protein A2X61_14790 [Ignavibacteria bacterium GWB2_35_12]OGU94204.1 MAG: hypothetical protein A2220_01725 [Ignavibacteria bacterium RIFOXYA2_FULL_35_10]OGV23416.1 MAG: hypothetical protein A2475_06465 [Ignavibacteria bacterium RIFOXYC2_FULL_35_21]